MTQNSNPIWKRFQFKQLSLSFMIATTLISYRANAEDIDNRLIDEFVKAKGYGSVITFDASNIKLFWVDKSVAAKNGSICISIENEKHDLNEVDAFPIQLANVSETQKCKIDVITKDENVSFSVLDCDSAVLSESAMTDDFIQYHIASASFDLNETYDFLFKLKFATTNNTLTINKIVLSFSENDSKEEPKTIKITKNELSGYNLSPDGDLSFTAKGINSQLSLKNMLQISQNPVKVSAKIKNVGTIPTKIFMGFYIYGKDQAKLDGKNYPYRNLNDILTVVSSSKENNSVIVDKYPKWTKNCNLAIDAKEDLSDIPNTNLLDGKIIEVKKLADEKAEIIMDKPFANPLEIGTKVRIHDISGYYIYTNIKVLQPDEEFVFRSKIRKDEDFLQYSPVAFSRGVFYMKPLIFSYSEVKGSENTIRISDYSISY